MKGIIRLSNALTRIEERLSRLLEQTEYMSLSSPSSTSIPDHNTWIVTMWHFGIDSLREFVGDRFEMSWKMRKII
jgi:hypothetical protein